VKRATKNSSRAPPKAGREKMAGEAGKSLSHAATRDSLPYLSAFGGKPLPFCPPQFRGLPVGRQGL